ARRSQHCRRADFTYASEFFSAAADVVRGERRPQNLLPLNVSPRSSDKLSRPSLSPLPRVIPSRRVTPPPSPSFGHCDRSAPRADAIELCPPGCPPLLGCEGNN